MDFKVIITETATDDLRDAVRYIAQDNAKAAERVGNEILDRFEMLAKFPFMGRVVPERGEPEWRELIYKSYRLIYHVNEPRQLVHAARVWHGARGLPHLDEIEL
jgi:plasmid stabilization system protein ParE